MTSIEFGKMCKPYNIEYKNLFGYVPCPTDYLCNQEEFILALIKTRAKSPDFSQEMNATVSGILAALNILELGLGMA